MKKIDYIKDNIIKNKHRILPVVSLVRSCVSSVTSMRENPNVFDYVDLAFAWKENFEDILGPSTPSGYFDNDEWQPFFNPALFKFVVGLLVHSYPKEIRMVKSSGAVAAYVVELDDIKFGWVLNGERYDYFCITRDKNEKAYAIVQEIFWKTYTSGQVIVGVESDEISFKEDTTHGNFIKFKKCTEMAEYINEFYKKGVGRSILFYGPPGSGKTNLVKGITYCLSSKTMRFIDLSNLAASLVSEVLRIVNPDSVVLEDIDHMSNEEITDLLDKIEDFNNQKKMVFATANEVSKLDNALLRPGRFDEVVEINQLDEEVLRKIVGDDEEILEITRNFPVAFTVELLKRIQVLGKEVALQNMDDIIDRIENIKDTNYELRNSAPDFLNKTDDLPIGGAEQIRKVRNILRKIKKI